MRRSRKVKDLSPKNSSDEERGVKQITIRFYTIAKNPNIKPEFSHKAFFNENEMLGSGGFGTVYKGHISEKYISKLGSQPFVIKKMKYSTKIPPQSVRDLPEKMKEEAIIFKSYHSNYGTSFISYQFYQNRKEVDVYLQIPEIPGQALTQYENLTLLERLLLGEEAISEVSNFHLETELAHCDIKNTNMMFKFDEKGNCAVSLIDFGSCYGAEIEHNEPVWGSTLLYAAPATYSNKSKDLVQGDYFSLGLALLEIVYTKEIFKFRIEKNEEIEKENSLIVKEFKRKFKDDKTKEYKKDYEGMKKRLMLKRLRKVSETKIDYTGLLVDPSIVPSLEPYIKDLRESLKEWTNVNSKEPIDLSSKQFIFGKTVGITIAYYFLQRMSAIQTEDSLPSLQQNFLAARSFLDLLYSQSRHLSAEIELYPARTLGANKFFRDCQEECVQLNLESINFFSKENTYHTFLELGVNKVIELYREKNINESEFGKTLKSFFVDQDFYDSESSHDYLIDVINTLCSCCKDFNLKNVLQELSLAIENNEDIKSPYSSIYDAIIGIVADNAGACDHVSRFRELLLALGERPSDRLIETACIEFQKQMPNLQEDARFRVSNSPVVIFSPSSNLEVAEESDEDARQEHQVAEESDEDAQQGHQEERNNNLTETEAANRAQTNQPKRRGGCCAVM